MATKTKPNKHKETNMTETQVTGENNTLKAAADYLKEACYTVEFETTWFATQRRATPSERSSMLNASSDEADASMVGISLKMLDVRDPYIRKMNAAKTALIAYRDSVTIPSAQLPLTAIAEGSKSVADAEKKLGRILKKKPGERIILAGDVDQFDDYTTNVLIPNLHNAVKEANDNIDEIRAGAQKKLNKRFIAELFPDEFVIGVRGPDYGEVGVSVSFEQVCPAAALRLKEIVKQRFEDTIELAVADFATSFLATVEIAAEQLACKTKFMPSSKHELRKLKDGVLKAVRIHKDDPLIPEGSRMVEVEYAEGSKKITEEFGPFTDEEYELLNPYESSQTGKVYQSTFDKLLNDLKRFDQIRTMLGDTGAPMENLVDEVRKLLRSSGGNAKHITDEVKASRFFRTTVAATLGNVADKIESLVDSMPIAQPKRRRAITKLVHKSPK